MENTGNDSKDTSKFNLHDAIGDYVIEERLGGGDYSSSFRGIHKTSHESVAIKVFSKSSSLARNLYKSEIDALKALKGLPGILQLKSHVEQDDFNFIVTEFIEEGSLRSILKKYPYGMNVDEAIQLFTPIADAIDRIHAQNIVHRDLKPENILCRRSDKGYQIYITDFGVVKFTADSQQFRTEHTAGTSWYIAPEAWKADPNFAQTKAVDIYALGVMLYEALEGKVPFEDIDEIINSKPVPSPSRTIQKTDALVVEYLLRAINNDPEQRPKSAREVINGIRNAHEGNLSTEQKWIGRQFKNYVVEELLGSGGMGISLRARDVQTNKQVVLKAFMRSLSGNALHAYDKEKRSLDRLENGHGVLIPHDRFEHEHVLFIVTEYQSGGTLRNLLNKRPRLTTNEILDIFTQIAEAVDYIHDRKIVHRDIKPENIVYSIVDGKINTFITDFGVSAILASTQSSFRTHEIGTPRYMAPELWDSNARGTKAVDIYAFGTMLYEALEGNPPFEAEGRAVIKHHFLHAVPVPETTLKELGVNAKNILLQALAKDAVERPKTATEIMQQIRGQHAMYLGERYGRYVIEKFVGQGTYGATYRAYDRSKNQKKKFAFKILSVPEPLMHEIDALKKIGHHYGILPILDGKSEKGIHYIVTDYINGLNLRDMLQSNRQGMTMPEVLKMFKPLAKALDYLHNNGVIHGDLKPENIVLNKTKNDTNLSEPFITGFGLSKIAGKSHSFYSKSNFHYIAPELWEDAEPSPASDLYALGVIIYEALEGTPPFTATSIAGIVRQHLEEDPPVPKNLLKSHGGESVRFLLKSLSKKPEQRQNSAQQLIAQLDKTGQTRTPTTAGRITGLWISLKSSFSPPKRLSLAPMPFLGLVLLAFMAAVVIFSNSFLRPVIPDTGNTAATLTTTFSTITITSTGTPPTPTASTPPPIENTIPASVLACGPDYASTQRECRYLVSNSISLEKLFTQFYESKPSKLDLYAIAYHNNRKALEEENNYSNIDPVTLEVGKGSTIFLPSIDAIKKYGNFPFPILEEMGSGFTSSEINLSGSSALEPLSLKIKEGFEEVVEGLHINIDSNNTQLGLTDFCQSRAHLFGVSERNFQNCSKSDFLKFEIARYAVIILINEEHPDRSKLIEKPLTSGELNKLLTIAKTWKEVRTDLSDEPINRYYPSTDGGAFEIVKNEIFPTVELNSISYSESENESSIPEKVTEDKFSIGFASYANYQKHIDKLMAIAVNKVAPNRETIMSETPVYPLTRKLYLYTGKLTYQENHLLQYFINYYLTYEFDYLDELGYFPPSKGFIDNPYTIP